MTDSVAAPVGAQVLVRVPATSANLGPGFDALGLAMSCHDEVTVRVTAGGLDVTVTGQGAPELPRTEEHLVVRAIRAGLDQLGVAQPGLAVTCTNRIPQARGLGSSAAAIVAGVVAARRIAGAPRADGDALDLAAALEGHPDNVAACLLGGLTVAWTEAGRSSAVRLEPVPSLALIAYVPNERTSTEAARGVLPANVPHADAAANAGRAALLVHALCARPDLLLAATQDHLHQPYRLPAVPASAALLHALRADGVPAVLSGSGPTVLALVEQGLTDDGSRPRRAPDGFTAVPLAVDRRGAVVTSSRRVATA